MPGQAPEEAGAGTRMAGERGVITAQCKHSQANIMIIGKHRHIETPLYLDSQSTHL